MGFGLTYAQQYLRCRESGRNVKPHIKHFSTTNLERVIMSANQTTFKTLGVDKVDAIEEMTLWANENTKRGIQISELHRSAVVFSPMNEEIENPDMFFVSFSHCNTDETKFRPNVGAWLAFESFHCGEVTVMRKDMLLDILELYEFRAW